MDGTDDADSSGPQHNSGGQQKALHSIDATRKVGFVPRHVYEKQSVWYHNVRQKYGVPLDSRHLYTKTDWEFFATAVASKAVRSEVLESVAKWVNETNTNLPFTDLHDTEGKGGFAGPAFFARPVVGGHFAFLALERSCGGRAMQGLDYLNEPKNNDDMWDAATKSAASFRAE